jgi:hypothetical protein
MGWDSRCPPGPFKGLKGHGGQKALDPGAGLAEQVSQAVLHGWDQ